MLTYFNQKTTKEEIEYRLTIIDSKYSKNMSMRFFGIEEIADAILNLSINDEELGYLFLNSFSNHSIKTL